MKKPYRILPRASTPSSRELAAWLAKDGQLLIPLVELIEKGERAIDEVIDVMGRATVEALLEMRAEQVGPKAQGTPRSRPEGVLAWRAGGTGRADGTAVAGRQAAAAQEAAACRRVGRGRDSGVCGAAGRSAVGGSDAGVGAQRRIHAPLRAGAAGDGRPGGHQQIRSLAGDHRGGDARSGAAGRTGPERAGRVGGLPRRDPVRGLPRAGGRGCRCDRTQARAGSSRWPVREHDRHDGPARGVGRARAAGGPLFVIDGAKALRSAIGHVFGAENLVQRCRNHKVRRHGSVPTANPPTDAIASTARSFAFAVAGSLC